ncbi:putative RNA-directed DNA polymerase, partial [Tanacetum coccineum]
VGHPNGTIAKINHVGNLKLTNNVVLFDVLVIPEYTVSLLSVNKMIKDSKLHVGFNEYDCVIQDLKKEIVLGTGSESGGLYVFDVDCKFPKVKSNFSILCCHVSKCVWHKRLGHPSDQVLKVLKTSLKLTKPDHNDPCDICHFSKQTREPFPLSDHTSESLGDLIHLDLWGPYRVTSREGYRYFLTIVDDFSRAVWVYLLKSKDEVFGYFVEFVNLIANQFLKRIKTVRSDNGTEFINNKMEQFLKENGIVHQTSCAYTPQQNGIAERKHRHLLNVARSLMFQGNIPLCFWTDCILTATYLINRLPSSVLAGRSPFSMLYGREPSLSHLRCFGCLCFSSILNTSDKFSSKSEKCILIGYSSSKKAYKLLSLENRSYIFSRDVKFYETIFPYKMKSNKTIKTNSENEVNSKNFFDFSESGNQNISRPNDDGEGPSDDAGEVIVDHQSTDTAEEQPFDDDIHTASSMDDNLISEGNEPNPQPIPTFDSSNRTDDDSPDFVNPRRSSRASKLPDKLNDFVLDDRIKEKVASGLIKTVHVESENQIADILTKGVLKSVFFYHDKFINLKGFYVGHSFRQMAQKFTLRFPGSFLGIQRKQNAETNQLQKMSLSDPQEQNSKKDLVGDCTFDFTPFTSNQFQTCSPGAYSCVDNGMKFFYFCVSLQYVGSLSENGTHCIHALGVGFASTDVGVTFEHQDGAIGMVPLNLRRRCQRSVGKHNLLILLKGLQN